MGRDLAIDLGTANTLVYREGDADMRAALRLHRMLGSVGVSCTRW